MNPTSHQHHRAELDEEPTGMTPTLEQDVQLYLHLADQIHDLTQQHKEVKHRLASRGAGHHTVGAVTLTVRPPARTFNPDRGWSMLTSAQQLLCVSPDPRKIKAQLPPVLLEECMDPGKGDPVVTVK